MKYNLRYVAQQYQHGWSLWIERDGKKFMLGSALESEQDVEKLINDIKIEEKVFHDPENTKSKLKEKVKEYEKYKVLYESLVEELKK